MKRITSTECTKLKKMVCDDGTIPTSAVSLFLKWLWSILIVEDDASTEELPELPELVFLSVEELFRDMEMYAGYDWINNRIYLPDMPQQSILDLAHEARHYQLFKSRKDYAQCLALTMTALGAHNSTNSLLEIDALSFAALIANYFGIPIWIDQDITQLIEQQLAC